MLISHIREYLLGQIRLMLTSHIRGFLLGKTLLMLISHIREFRTRVAQWIEYITHNQDTPTLSLVTTNQLYF